MPRDGSHLLGRGEHDTHCSLETGPGEGLEKALQGAISIPAFKESWGFGWSLEVRLCRARQRRGVDTGCWGQLGSLVSLTNEGWGIKGWGPASSTLMNECGCTLTPSWVN